MVPQEKSETGHHRISKKREVSRKATDLRRASLDQNQNLAQIGGVIVVRMTVKAIRGIQRKAQPLNH